MRRESSRKQCRLNMSPIDCTIESRKVSPALINWILSCSSVLYFVLVWFLIKIRVSPLRRWERKAICSHVQPPVPCCLFLLWSFCTSSCLPMSLHMSDSDMNSSRGVESKISGSPWMCFFFFVHSTPAYLCTSNVRLKKKQQQRYVFLSWKATCWLRRSSLRLTIRRLVVRFPSKIPVDMSNSVVRDRTSICRVCKGYGRQKTQGDVINPVFC